MSEGASFVEGTPRSVPTLLPSLPLSVSEVPLYEGPDGGPSIHRKRRKGVVGTPGSAASGASEQPGTGRGREPRPAPTTPAVRGACPTQRKPTRILDRRERSVGRCGSGGGRGE
jgi:hypothetical protein